MFYVWGGKSLTSLSSPLENNGDSTSKLIIRKVTQTTMGATTKMG